jgi:hypothetical protein
VPDRIDAETAAYLAIIAICFTLIGGLLTAGQLGIAERGTVLVAIGTVLFGVAWRARRHPPKNGDD